jgi:hypothetical protein
VKETKLACATPLASVWRRCARFWAMLKMNLVQVLPPVEELTRSWYLITPSDLRKSPRVASWTACSIIARVKACADWLKLVIRIDHLDDCATAFRCFEGFSNPIQSGQGGRLAPDHLHPKGKCCSSTSFGSARKTWLKPLDENEILPFAGMLSITDQRHISTFDPTGSRRTLLIAQCERALRPAL